MANEVKTRLTVEDLSKQQVTAFEKSVEAMGSRVKSSFNNVAASIAAALSVSSLISFGKQAVAAAAEAEEAEAKYVAMRKASNEATGVSIEKIKALAAELQRTTKFEDDNTVAVAANLLRYENMSEEVFPRVIRLAADMADVFGGLSGAANMLGRGLNDPANASRLLRTAGVELSDTVREQIKAFKESGDVGKAQALILEELEKRFGGLAGAMGDTFSGRLAKLANQWGDVQETLGNSLIPTIEKVMPLLDEFSRRFQATMNDAADASASSAGEGPSGKGRPGPTWWGQGWLPGTKGFGANFMGGLANIDQVHKAYIETMMAAVASGGAGYRNDRSDSRKYEGLETGLAEYFSHLRGTLFGLRVEQSETMAQRHISAMGARTTTRPEKAPELDYYEQQFGREGEVGTGSGPSSSWYRDTSEAVDWDAVKARIRAEEELTKAAEQAATDREKMRQDEYSGFSSSKPKRDEGFQSSIEDISSAFRRIQTAAASRESEADKVVQATQDAGQKTVEAMDKVKELLEGGVEAQERAARSLEVLERQESGLA